MGIQRTPHDLRMARSVLSLQANLSWACLGGCPAAQSYDRIQRSFWQNGKDTFRGSGISTLQLFRFDSLAVLCCRSHKLLRGPLWKRRTDNQNILSTPGYSDGCNLAGARRLLRGFCSPSGFASLLRTADHLAVAVGTILPGSDNVERPGNRFMAWRAWNSVSRHQAADSVCTANWHVCFAGHLSDEHGTATIRILLCVEPPCRLIGRVQMGCIGNQGS